MSWGIVAGAAVGLAGSAMSADAAGDAADAQSDAAARTDATNRYIFDKQTELQKPFRDTGVLANNRLAYMMGLGPNTGSAESYDLYQQRLAAADADHRRQYGVGLDEIDQGVADRWRQDILNGSRVPGSEAGAGGGGEYGSLLKKFGIEDFEADPGYQFRMDEGMRGVEGGAAARGGLLSGAALKAIQKYGQNFASNEYGNSYGRFTNDQTNTYNRLAGLVNSGQGASNQISNAAGQYAQNTASNNAALGNAQAAGAIGQANAWSNGLGQAYNGYQNQQIINKLKPSPTANGLMQWYE